MTYGETGGAIRAGLTELLREQRIQYRLSASPRRFINSTGEQRAEYAAQATRYRRTLLSWCHQATVVADPYLADHDFFGKKTRPSNPYEFLRADLERVIDTSTAPLPTTEELSTRHEVGLVESWRQIARAAAIGEHDFGADETGDGRGRMTATQCRIIVADVAAITQAVVILDNRYRYTPGWEKLRQPGRLGWAALSAALDASIDPPDYTVDHRGWRAPLPFVRGPVRPGLTGVLQAEQNLLVRLTNAISTTNIRLVVGSQRIISTELADRCADPDLADRWRTRSKTYDQLHRSLRDVSPGHTSHGHAAGQEAGALVDRIKRLPPEVRPDEKLLAAFDKRFNHMDRRLADLIENGIENGTILRRTRLPRLDKTSGQLVKTARERYAPIRGSDSDLPSIVRNKLRPSPHADPPQGAARSRADLYAAIVSNTLSRSAPAPTGPRIRR